MKRIFKSIYLFIRAVLTPFGALPTLFANSKILRVTVIVLVVLFGLYKLYELVFPEPPKSVMVYGIFQTEQDWTEDQRQKYYQTSQGCLIVPYNWFLALEQAPKLNWPINLVNKNLFRSDKNMTRYRVIPDPRPKYNPDRLPIGITKNVVRDEYVDQLGDGHKEWMSYSCALCHTAQINYKGLGIRIDGAPSMWNFATLNQVMTSSLIATVELPTKFRRFADKVLGLEGRENTKQARDLLKEQVNKYIKSPLISNALKAALNNTYTPVSGFGRMNALGRGGNGQFAQLDPRNIAASKGPVSIPPIWYTHEYDWVQSISGINQPMGRNVTESWGVNSIVDLINPNRDRLFASTVTMKDMFWMETLISVLEPPKWPETILGKINRDAVKRGKYLYEEKIWEDARRPAQAELAADTASHIYPPNPDRTAKGFCARCHAPVRHVNPNKWGKRYIQLPLYRLDVIGTDPWDAEDFAGHEIYTRNLSWLFDGKEKVGIGEALLKVTTEVMKRGYEELGITDTALQDTMNGFRENLYRAPLAYPARPLAGYWTTPPFLHNGSVPNLYQLLSPVKERDESFWVGDLEFDPVQIGYKTEKFEGGFEFKIKRGVFSTLLNTFLGVFRGRLEYVREIDGNSNAGHEFRDAEKNTPGVIGPYLEPADRMAIIEYMKVLGYDSLISQEELERRKAILKGLASEYEESYEKSKYDKKED